MTKIPLWRMVVVVTAAALALAIAASAFAQTPTPPGFPAQFFGSANSGSGAILDGAAADDGSVVTAWNQDDENVGEGTIGDGEWVIGVDSDRATSVTFSIGASGQSGSYDVVGGGVTEVALDLTTPDVEVVVEPDPGDGMGDGDGDGMGDGMGDGYPDGLPVTGSGGLTDSGGGFPLLPLVLSVGLALGGMAVARRHLRA